MTFAPPEDPRTVSHSMTIRVPDCQEAYRTLVSRGAEFITPPYDWGSELRSSSGIQTDISSRLARYSSQARPRLAFADLLQEQSPERNANPPLCEYCQGIRRI